MPDICTIWLPEAVSTHSAGVSLASTIYRRNITIGFIGELGAGKTTFLQGFLEGLGVLDTVTSPTYALEQRYQGNLDGILHLDLYRLDEEKTDEFLHGSDDHKGIRCIEWIDRSNAKPDILVTLEDDRGGRNLTVQFDDITLPAESEILKWREEVVLPERICRHCDAVTTFAGELGDQLLHRGVILRPNALKAAAQVHDLLRFIDFVPGGGHGKDEEHTPKAWTQWKDRFEDIGHEAACAELLIERGYPHLAEIVRVHGLMLPTPDRPAIEQKLLFYADKRVKLDEVVTLEERFEDFRERYSEGKHSKDGDIWYAEAKALEEDLFPEGAPQS
ncbi:MAG: tRNA (adenosine(37)-N6)-threonylcarbamoyltransferase complex ATPase subunit type 1 TsaE [Candidatus Peribacteraceae bacterium]|jgi:tRNA threonylcarbamoyl adenosine modification protein YjeE|nr:tRNA (adenosine(37)-N6)-threonylcarbamoyltransferase complex ATPase subunit type 1 TsaE [bacterium]MDP6561659.1 tRNA (adenosine(37)-N6)-threonylcarbamoyltransferase complex ATPase subunit type 1 TsaE [Candidatus Peribacteraceae bacterium]|tara:strand:- start:3359 stop:4354 length:996 start_codon:yes stop_codon:yes gene_type:complete